MRKGVILITIMGIMIVVFLLAVAILFFTTQESRISEHKVKRNRAFFASQAGIIHALERLRKGDDISQIDGEVLDIGDRGEQGYPIKVTITVGDEIDVDDPRTALHQTRPVSATVNY